MMITHVMDRPFNDVRYYLNFNKLLALGWKPEVKFKDGLKRTVEWCAAPSPGPPPSAPPPRPRAHLDPKPS